LLGLTLRFSGAFTLLLIIEIVLINNSNLRIKWIGTKYPYP